MVGTGSASGGQSIPGKILIVDDDPQLCHVLADTLKESGYDASSVQNAEQALLKAITNPPHLILLDVEIPQMGGLALCQKLRGNNSTNKLPIVFLTVRDSDFDRQAALAMGANQYLTKPFQKDQLLKVIEECGVPKSFVVHGRILIVDDDMELCQVIADTLKDKGYDTQFVQTAEDGFERALADPPDIFLLDLEVPRMGGLVLCQKLRATPQTKDIPIMFLTVRDSDFDRQTAFNLGANQYVTKPFRRSQLIKEVETLFAARKPTIDEDWVGPSLGHGQSSVPVPAVPTDAPAAAPVTPPIVPATTPRPVSVPQPPVRTPLPPQPPREEQTFGAPKNEEVFGAIAPVQARSAQPPAPTPLPTQPPTMRPQAVSTPAATGIKGFKDFSGAKPQPDKPSGGFKNWFFGHKWISISISVVLAAGLVWGSVALYKKFSGGKKEAAEENKEGALSEVSVNVMQVVPAPFQDILTAVGTVAGGSEIELRFQTEGNLRTLNFREGDSVKAGQLIAQLDQAQASIKLERARSEYYRYEKLYALGGVSKDRLDEARVQFDYAQTEMAKTVLRATQDGIFGDKGVEVGEFITPQKKVGTLVSLGTVMIRIGVIEKEIDKIFPGQVVTATVETYPNVEFKGKVENISPLVQGQTKTLMVEARVPNTGKLLLPGMFARTKIIIFEKDHVISVPNDALEKTQEGYRLYIVGKENKAEVRPVQVSYVSLTHSVISSGIEPGEQVIIQRPQELKEGAPLKVVEVEKPVSKLEGMGAGAGGDQGHSESAGEESPR